MRSAGVWTRPADSPKASFFQNVHHIITASGVVLDLLGVVAIGQTERDARRLLQGGRRTDGEKVVDGAHRVRQHGGRNHPGHPPARGGIGLAEAAGAAQRLDIAPGVDDRTQQRDLGRFADDAVAQVTAQDEH